MKYLTILICFIFLISCKSTNKHSKAQAYYIPKDAKGFAIDTANGSYILRVKNPWQGASGIEYRYVIGHFERNSCGEDSIALPIRNVICMSTSYAAYIESLGVVSSINGMAGQYAYSPYITEAMRKGKISDVGYDYNLDVEKILKLKPDVIFVYGVDGEFQAVAKKLRKFGMKLVFIGDYLEESPLGKAEWRVALSLFYEKQRMAIGEHMTLRSRYTKMKDLVTNISNKPKVMLNTPYNDVWFLPGKRNYISHLIQDAGATFAYETKDQRETYPIPFESAWLSAGSADFWLNVGSMTNLSQIKDQMPRFYSIPAVKECKVYNNNKRRTPTGGSDFWESGAVCPDVILKDLIRIFHPTLLQDQDSLYYYRQLR